jgi:hypothetical protein
MPSPSKKKRAKGRGFGGLPKLSKKGRGAKANFWFYYDRKPINTWATERRLAEKRCRQFIAAGGDPEVARAWREPEGAADAMVNAANEEHSPPLDSAEPDVDSEEPSPPHVDGTEPDADDTEPPASGSSISDEEMKAAMADAAADANEAEQSDPEPAGDEATDTMLSALGVSSNAELVAMGAELAADGTVGVSGFLMRQLGKRVNALSTLRNAPLSLPDDNPGVKIQRIGWSKKFQDWGANDIELSGGMVLILGIAVSGLAQVAAAAKLSEANPNPQPNPRPEPEPNPGPDKQDEPERLAV